jgi:hypothetical protein
LALHVSNVAPLPVAMLEETAASLTKKNWNHLVVKLFAPLLVLIGVLGLVLPEPASVTSGALPYDIFHIFFGFIGIGLLILNNDHWLRLFSIGFGSIDIYQAIASFLHLFPEHLFRWTRVDDVLHIVIGCGLVAVGLYREDRNQE